MNFTLAFLLQGAEKSAPDTHTPGMAGGFSMIMIVAFLVGFLALAACAVWMVMRGAVGVAKAESKDEEKK